MSADEQERAEAEAVEKARRDIVARLRSAEMKGLAEGRAEGKAEGLTEGRAEGKAEGLAEGKAERNREVALAMLQGGLSIEQIYSFTGLTAEEIKNLNKLQ